VFNAPKSSIEALLRGLVDAGFVVVADGAHRLRPGAFDAAVSAARYRYTVARETPNILRDAPGATSDTSRKHQRTLDHDRRTTERDRLTADLNRPLGTIRLEVGFAPRRFGRTHRQRLRQSSSQPPSE
jgi:hypothetical protein